MKKILYIALLLLSVSITAQISVDKKLKITDTPNTATPSDFLTKTTGDHLVKATTFSQLVALMQSNLIFASPSVNNNYSVNQTFAQDVTIQGNLFVNGGTTTINSQITSTDSVIDMNSGEVGNGVTSGFSGLNINRGSSTSFAFGFDEIRDSFVLGKVTDLSAVNVATMQDVATRSGLGSWISGNLPFWNAANKRFEDSGLRAGSVWNTENSNNTTANIITVGGVKRAGGTGSMLFADDGSMKTIFAFGVEPFFTKNSAFNKNFGTQGGTVLEGNALTNYYHTGNLNKSDVDFLANNGTFSGMLSAGTNHTSSPFNVTRNVGETGTFANFGLDNVNPTKVLIGTDTWGGAIRLYGADNTETITLKGEGGAAIFSGQVIVEGQLIVTSPFMQFTGPNSQNKIISFKTDGSSRWAMYANSVSETGANSGTDFSISRYTDAGAFIDTPIYITRATGDVGFSGDIAAGGDATFSGNMTVSGSVYANNILNYKGSASTSGDWNNITTMGVYQTANADLSTVPNTPNNAYGYGLLEVVTNTANVVTQRFVTHTSVGAQIFARHKFNASDWQPWVQVYTSANINNITTPWTASTLNLDSNIDFLGDGRVKTNGGQNILYIQNDIAGVSKTRFGVGSADHRVEIEGILDVVGDVDIVGDLTMGKPSGGSQFTSTLWGGRFGGGVVIESDAVTTDRRVRVGIITGTGAYGGGLTIENDTKAIFSNTVTSPNFIIGSDRRLKTNILPISKEEIQINYKQFERKDTPGQLRYGVIAQELELGNPELVYTDEKGEKSVAYIDLLIREIAFLKAQNEIKNKQIKDILTALSKKQDIPYFGLTPVNSESQYKTRLKKRALNLRKQF